MQFIYLFIYFTYESVVMHHPISLCRLKFQQVNIILCQAIEMIPSYIYQTLGSLKIIRFLFYKYLIICFVLFIFMKIIINY